VDEQARRIMKSGLIIILPAEFHHPSRLYYRLLGLKRGECGEVIYGSKTSVPNQFPPTMFGY
jgi:hypothetical protein